MSGKDCYTDSKLQKRHTFPVSALQPTKMILLLLELNDNRKVAEMVNVSRHPIWHRLTSWIAVCALVMQGAFVGLATSLPTAAASGFEICHHQTEDTAISPGETPSDHDATFHCPLCVAGGPGFVCPARVSVPMFVISDAGSAWRPVSEPRGGNSFAHSDHQSRAPPVEA